MSETIFLILNYADNLDCFLTGIAIEIDMFLLEYQGY